MVRCFVGTVLLAGWLAGCLWLPRQSRAGGLADDLPPPPTLAAVTKKLQSGEPLVFATFGDSITWPCYHTDFRQNYITFAVDALRRAYPKANVKIVHAGNMGSAGRGLADTRFERYVLAHKPDLVVIMYGMNDCGGGEGGLEAYDRHLTQLIKMTRDRGAAPVIATQNEIIYDSPDGAPRRALPLYMGRALQVAAREQALAADCFALWKPLLANRDELGARLNDWIHPNHAGHRLMAKALLKALWPEAAAFVSDAVRTPVPPDAGPPLARLLPGPPGKQVLQTRAGIWIAISGRSREDKLHDLVFSFSRKPQPNWEDFEHVTLIGTGPESVFDAMDRTLTAGLLLEQEERVLVVFSWNVGVFVVSLDLRKPDWEAELRNPATWLALTDAPFVRPIIVANDPRGTGLLHDAYLQPDGWPAVFCAARKPAPRAGWEITDGQDGIALVTRGPGKREAAHEFLFPEFHAVRCTQAGDGIYWAAQRMQGELSLLGKVGSERSIRVQALGEMLLPAVGGDRGIGVASRRTDQAPHGKWEALEWNEEVAWRELPPPTTEQARQGRIVPLPWSDGRRRGIAWREVPRGEGGRPAFAYQSRLAPGGELLGILVENQGRLDFTATRVGSAQAAD